MEFLNCFQADMCIFLYKNICWFTKFCQSIAKTLLLHITVIKKCMDVIEYKILCHNDILGLFLY